MSLVLENETLPWNNTIPSIHSDTLNSAIEILSQQTNLLSDYINAQQPATELVFLIEHRTVLQKLGDHLKIIQQVIWCLLI